jgi:AraC-like DNA-binding protein
VSQARRFFLNLNPTSRGELTVVSGGCEHCLPDYEIMCTVALQYLMMKIGDVAVPYGETAGRAFATYQRCRQYIEDHYAELRGLHEVADGCHINLSYLCRLFQRFGRERPFRYLQHLRLNHAAELLQNSGRLVKEVSDELGFSEPGNFSRTFQRTFGLPPERVRRITG